MVKRAGNPTRDQDVCIREVLWNLSGKPGSVSVVKSGMMRDDFGGDYDPMQSLDTVG
jgi:hypothetical protein